MSAGGRETSWHVSEVTDIQGGTPDRSFTVANTRPRLLHWIVDPYLDTHRVIAAHSLQMRKASYHWGSASGLGVFNALQSTPTNHPIIGLSVTSRTTVALRGPGVPPQNAPHHGSPLAFLCSAQRSARTSSMAGSRPDRLVVIAQQE